MHTSVNIINQHVTLTCKQATLMASRSMDERLSLHEGLKLRWHLLICPNCVNYFRQIKLIRKIFRQRQKSAVYLSYEARQRIARALSEATTVNSTNQERS